MHPAIHQRGLALDQDLLQFFDLSCDVGKHLLYRGAHGVSRLFGLRHRFAERGLDLFAERIGKIGCGHGRLRNMRRQARKKTRLDVMIHAGHDHEARVCNKSKQGRSTPRHVRIGAKEDSDDEKNGTEEAADRNGTRSQPALKNGEIRDRLRVAAGHP